MDAQIQQLQLLVQQAAAQIGRLRVLLRVAKAHSGQRQLLLPVDLAQCANKPRPQICHSSRAAQRQCVQRKPADKRPQGRCLAQAPVLAGSTGRPGHRSGVCCWP